jgi:hypothetical protein
VRPFNTLLVAAALLCAGAAQAATDCKSTIIKVATDVGTGSPHFYALTAAGVGFDIPDTDASYKTVMGFTSQAMLTGTEVVLRFRADAVNCASKNEYRKDLIGFVIDSSGGR